MEDEDAQKVSAVPFPEEPFSVTFDEESGELVCKYTEPF
jgi:hypothetical protein